MNQTASGKACRMWSDEESEQWPDKGLDGNHNSCRNPIPVVRDAPWCFTRISQWEYCKLGAYATSAPPKRQLTIQANLQCCWMKTRNECLDMTSIRKNNGTTQSPRCRAKMGSKSTHKFFRWYLEEQDGTLSEKVRCPFGGDGTGSLALRA